MNIIDINYIASTLETKVEEQIKRINISITDNKKLRAEIGKIVSTIISDDFNSLQHKAKIGNYQFTYTDSLDRNFECAIDLSVHDEEGKSSPSITCIDKLSKFYSPTYEDNYLFLMIAEYNSKDNQVLENNHSIKIQVQLIEHIDVSLFSAESLGRGQIHISSLNLSPYTGTRDEWMDSLYDDVHQNYILAKKNIDKDIAKYKAEQVMWKSKKNPKR